MCMDVMTLFAIAVALDVIGLDGAVVLDVIAFGTMNVRRSLAICPLTSSRLSCRGSDRSPRERTRSSWDPSCTGAVLPFSLSELPPCLILLMPPRTVSTDSKSSGERNAVGIIQTL